MYFGQCKNCTNTRCFLSVLYRKWEHNNHRRHRWSLGYDTWISIRDRVQCPRPNRHNCKNKHLGICGKLLYSTRSRLVGSDNGKMGKSWVQRDIRRYLLCLEYNKFRSHYFSSLYRQQHWDDVSHLFVRHLSRIYRCFSSYRS